MKVGLTISLLLIILPLSTIAQEAIQPRPSPVAIVSAHYKDTYLKITYSQPHHLWNAGTLWSGMENGRQRGHRNNGD